MIVWLNPAAWAGAIALLGPILVHLWRRHRLDRVSFPSLRFVPAAGPIAARVGTPSDIPLLLVRSFAVLCAVAALTRPLVVTPSRIDRWNRAVARIVVADASESMRGREALVADAYAAETRAADWTASVEDASLASGIRRAASLFHDAPPARREIVVISDFQQGALTREAIDAVPSNIGLRFVAVGALTHERMVQGLTLLDGTAATEVQDVLLAGPRTSVTQHSSGGVPAGLRLEAAPQDREAITQLFRAVGRAGAPVPDPAQPLVAVFSGGTPPAVKPLATAWMWRTALRLMRDREAASAAALTSASTTAPADPEWLVLLRDQHEAPLLRVGAAGAGLVLDVRASPAAYVSAAVLRGVLWARAAAPGDREREQEIERTPQSDLTRWSRAAAPVGADVWRTTSQSDARWLWIAALVMLGIETALRRSGPASAHEAQAHAA